jgi:hypothetical protein
MRMRTTVGALLAGCGIAAAGCSGEALGPESLPGDYVLVSMGGHLLPAVVVPPGGPRTYLSGSLTLGTDQRYVQVTDLQRCLESCTVTPVTVLGTWSVRPDGTLFFDRDDGDAYPEPVALAEGRRITFCGGVVDEPCSPAKVFERR